MQTTKAPVDVVLDINILVSALRSKSGASRRVLDLVLAGTLSLHVTVPLVLEYEETLLRGRSNLGLSYRDVIILLAALLQRARRHEVYYLWRLGVRDSDDAHVLEAAVASGCSRLVSFNKRDFPGAAGRGVRILRPGVFLGELRRAGLIT